MLRFKNQIKKRNNIQIMDINRRLLGGPTIDLSDVNKHHLKFSTETNTAKY